MLIAILSDIHDNLPNLHKALAYVRQKGAEAMVCCGDVTSEETLEELSAGFKGPIHLIRGNADFFVETFPATLSNVNYYGLVGRVELGGVMIGLCHQPFRIPDVLALGSCRVVFYGHKHMPMIDEREGVMAVNPGTVAGINFSAAFALWDTAGNIELVRIDELSSA